MGDEAGRTELKAGLEQSSGRRLLFRQLFSGNPCSKRLGLGTGLDHGAESTSSLGSPQTWLLVCLPLHGCVTLSKPHAIQSLGFLLSLMEINQFDLTGQSKGFIEVLAALIIDAQISVLSYSSSLMSPAIFISK